MSRVGKRVYLKLDLPSVTLHFQHQWIDLNTEQKVLVSRIANFDTSFLFEYIPGLPKISKVSDFYNKFFNLFFFHSLWDSHSQNLSIKTNSENDEWLSYHIWRYYLGNPNNLPLFQVKQIIWTYLVPAWVIAKFIDITCFRFICKIKTSIW